jgi:tetraacyldisaccharide 4'-kinase
VEWIYRRAMQSRRATNLKRRQREIAPCPILSVGNITTGGTGKTPTVQWATRFLQAKGLRVGVVGRGYGGSLSEAGALVSEGRGALVTAAQAGDEAVLHARDLPDAIVVIGKDRHQAVNLAVHQGAQVVVLDDGFQFWSLPRAFDLVLLDAKEPFGNGHLLPFGRLREEPEDLERADAILLTRAGRATREQLEFWESKLRDWTDAPVYLSHHGASDLYDEKSGEMLPTSWLKGRSIKAFAGLADNEQFYSTLQNLGAAHLVKLSRAHGDHHQWKKSDFSWADAALQINQYQSSQFDALPVVTTEKDAVKLDPHWFSEQLLSLRIALKVEGESELQRLISSKLLS